jgi:hypothetical protein
MTGLSVDIGAHNILKYYNLAYTRNKWLKKIYNHIKKIVCNTSYVQQASYIRLQKFFVCKGQIVDIWVAKLEQKEIQINTTTLQFHDDLNWLIRLHLKFLRLPIQCHLSIKPFPIACVM